MNRGLRIALVATVIFSSGLAAGHSLSGIRAKSMRRQALSRNEVDRRGSVVAPPMGPMGHRLEFLRKAQHELDLTPEQRSRVESHLDTSRERIRKLWEPVLPQVSAEAEALKVRIREELTSAQAERFDRLLETRNRRGNARDRRGNQVQGPDGGSVAPRLHPAGR